MRWPNYANMLRQPALFNIGVEETETAEKSTPDGRIGESRVTASLP
jgi:hypothetical protein